MNTSNWTVILSQLVGQSPTLLAYLLGLVLCAIWWRRAPSAAIYAMLGCGILLLTTVGVTLVQAYFITGGRPPASIGPMLFAIGIGSSIVRAVGFGLLLAGVFAGRPRLAEQAGFEVQQAMSR